MAMHKPSVAILGFGPTAVFAARAAADCGAKVTIYCSDPTILQTPPGAFWLHWVPTIFKDKFTRHKITITSTGIAAFYTKLQWGSADGIESSFPTKPVVEWGYNPEKTIRQLLPDDLGWNIRKQYLTADEISIIAASHDFTFQTFPHGEHFKTQPKLVPFVAAASFNSRIHEPNEVWYNGTGVGIAVREATLFGHHFYEYPKNMSKDEVLRRTAHSLEAYHLVELRDLDPASVPVTHPNPKVTLLGRMAMWDRKFLAHDAYQRVKEKMTNG